MTSLSPSLPFARPLTPSLSRSLVSQEGNTVDATQIVATYRALSSKGTDEAEATKDEL